jgi:hypothetical protein
MRDISLSYSAYLLAISLKALAAPAPVTSGRIQHGWLRR